MSCCMLSKPPTEKHGDHEVGARERPLAVELGGRREGDAAAARDLSAELLHQLQAFGVEVVQHDARGRRATACWRSRQSRRGAQ